MKRAPRAFDPMAGILPVQIRPDLTVCIHGLPLDLSKREADKISAVVMALATPNAPAGREG